MDFWQISSKQRPDKNKRLAFGPDETENNYPWVTGIYEFTKFP